MKIQELAIIFIIIILPISLLLSEYTQFQVQTLKTQTVYDSKLTAATYDAIKAFQLNSTNSSTSDLANSKLRDIEASVSAFRNSIMSAFKLNGYTEEALNNYIPALVYTMYDGFYIYSPYNNVNYQYEPIKDASGNPVKDGNGNVQYDTTKPTQGNGENLYGLKPYINYSCRYVKNEAGTDIDVIITYALDNYITVQGKIKNAGESETTYVNKSGYLVDGIVYDGNTVKYNGIEIEKEQLKEYLPISDSEGNIPQAYPYVKKNGTRYYLVGNQIIYFLNGTRLVQCTDTVGTDDEYDEWATLINNNNLGQEYYIQAAEFTKWFKDTDLYELTYADAKDVVIGEDDKAEIKNLWLESDNRKIFQDSINIENLLSNFNQHRLEIIRHKIETNLAIAISNYNTYSGATSNIFQMPELKEDEWDYITHNISLISFLQGLPIGGKIYNGYTIVTNSESKEVVLEEYIYILGKDGNYHRIGDNNFEIDNEGIYGEAGRLNLDFKRTMVTDSDNVRTYYYYPLKAYNASYNSIVMQNDVTTYDDIYTYLENQIDSGNEVLAKTFYTALGRERASKYNSDIYYELDEIETVKLTFDPNGGSGTLKEEYVYKETEISFTEENLPERDGYEFKGWSTDPDATESEYKSGGSPYIADEDETLYAVWKEIEYTIEYDLDGGYSEGPLQTGPFKFGDNVTIPPVKKDGYEFKGWTLTSLGGATVTKGPTGYSCEIDGNTANIKLKAVWSAEEYTLTYSAEGATGGIPAQQEWTQGSSITLSGSIPTRTGYSFKGWCKNSVGTGEIYGPGNEIPSAELPTSDMTLYAIWEEKTYTIIFNPNEGNGGPGTQTKTHGINMTIGQAKPTRTGYTFQGWATSSTATSAQYQPGDTYTANEDVTLYAVWKSSIEIPIGLGDFVNYDAGTWTKAEINAIKTGIKGNEITANGSTDMPTEPFQFRRFYCRFK